MHQNACFYCNRTGTEEQKSERYELLKEVDTIITLESDVIPHTDAEEDLLDLNESHSQAVTDSGKLINPLESSRVKDKLIADKERDQAVEKSELFCNKINSI